MKTANIDDWPDIDAQIYQFDRDWQAGSQPDILQLADSNRPKSDAEVKWLTEVALVDIEYRWRLADALRSVIDSTSNSGLPLCPIVEDYLKHIPALGSPIPLLEMIGQEYRVRSLWSSGVKHDEYLQRFPELAHDIRQRLDLVDQELEREQFERCSDSTSTMSLDNTQLNAAASCDGNSPLTGNFGRYQILRELGCGAMGEVYLAFDTQLERQVALKTPRVNLTADKQIVERFHREAKAMGQLQHSNLCPVFDVGELDGRLFLTMAYIDGPPLTHRLSKPEPLSPAEIAWLIRGIAAALAEAHRHGVVHRDLKPGNVLINQQGEPIVTDFGLALHRGSAADRLTQNGAMVGTPAYMAPEQIEDETGGIGPAADIYSLGAILYEALAGQLPFRGSTLAVLRQIADQQPLPPSQVRQDVDEQLETLCLQMLAKDPAARPQSMDEVVATIDRIGRDRLTVVDASNCAPASPATAHSNGGKVGRFISLAIAVSLLGIVAWGVTLTFTTSEGTIEVTLGEGVSRDLQIEVKPIDGDRVLIADASSNWQIEAAAGSYRVSVVGGDDRFKLSKNEVIVTRDKKETVRVTLRPTAQSLPTNDRDLAMWLLERGAYVKLGTAFVASIDQLPDGEFRIKGVRIGDGTTEVRMMQAEFETAMAAIVRLPELEELNLAGNSKEYPLRMTDSLARVIARQPNLHALALQGMGTRSFHLSLLQSLERLTYLHVTGASVDDVGLAHVERMPSLRKLRLEGSPNITRQGLERLQSLEYLSLRGSGIGDALIPGLASLKQLHELHLTGTSVSADGIKSLQASLPDTAVVGNSTDGAPADGFDDSQTE